MKEIINKWKADVLLTGVLCVVVGLIIMIWPAALTLLLGRVIGVVLVIMGLRQVYSYWQNRDMNRLGLASGAVIFALGALVLIRPAVIAQMIAIVVGVVLLMHGFEDLQMGMEGRNHGDERWWISVILAIAVIGFGIYVIWKYFQVAEITAWLLGFVLMFDGISNIIVAVKMISVTKEEK